MQKGLHYFLKSLAESKFFLPPDVFERHKFIANFIPKNSAVLDVGGSLSQLERFVSVNKIITVDIKPPADIIYDGIKIPLKDRSFDIITSIDVLEHIDKKNRLNFIKELCRVARDSVILSAPLGTEKHMEAEKNILRHYQSKNINVPYLEEHLKTGLPTPATVNNYIKAFKAKIYYSGDIRLTERLFKIHNFEPKNKFFNIVIFFVKLIFNSFINIFLYYFTVNRKQSDYTNRFYLIIDTINNKIN